MRYTEFRDAVHAALKQRGTGMTWAQLRDRLKLPYDRPCPEWTKRLEQEIGLAREKRAGAQTRSLVWRVRTGRAS